VKQNGEGFDKGSNFKILESSSYWKEAVTLTFFVGWTIQNAYLLSDLSILAMHRFFCSMLGWT